MKDEIIENFVWSMFYPGMRVRWTTPSFVRRGFIVKVKGRSMTVRFDGFQRDTVIPDARAYFVDYLGGRTDYTLVPLQFQGKAPDPTPVDTITGLPIDINSHDRFTDVATAANILGTDPKNVRRKLRAGTIKGSNESGRWLVDRTSL